MSSFERSNEILWKSKVKKTWATKGFRHSANVREALRMPESHPQIRHAPCHEKFHRRNSLQLRCPSHSRCMSTHHGHKRNMHAANAWMLNLSWQCTYNSNWQIQVTDISALTWHPIHDRGLHRREAVSPPYEGQMHHWSKLRPEGFVQLRLPSHSYCLSIRHYDRHVLRTPRGDRGIAFVRVRLPRQIVAPRSFEVCRKLCQVMR